MTRPSTNLGPLRRLADWFRRDYPSRAPVHGHCPLIALCGTDLPTGRA